MCLHVIIIIDMYRSRKKFEPTPFLSIPPSTIKRSNIYNYLIDTEKVLKRVT